MKEEHERATRAEHEKELERLQSGIRYQQELERQLEVRICQNIFMDMDFGTILMKFIIISSTLNYS